MCYSLPGCESATLIPDIQPFATRYTLNAGPWRRGAKGRADKLTRLRRVPVDIQVEVQQELGVVVKELQVFAVLPMETGDPEDTSGSALAQSHCP